MNTHHGKKLVRSTLGVAVAATIALPATAHADDMSWGFQIPSGNIGCVMMDNFEHTGYTVCRTVDNTLVAPPPGGLCTGDVAGSSDLLLSTGRAPCVGHWTGQILLPGHPLPTLDYGQTHTVGTITCDSEPSGVTCTDSSTGHFFRVSRESYQLG